MSLKENSPNSVTNDYLVRYSKYIKNVSVKCLQNLEDLKKICDRESLKFVYCSKVMSEVDFILDDEVKHGQKFYLVKWKGRGSKHNSWEPANGLTGSEDLLSYYNFLKKPLAMLSEERVFYFINDLSTRKPYDNLTITKLYALIHEHDVEYISKLGLTFADLSNKVAKYLNKPQNIRKLLYHRNELLDLMKFSEERKIVLSRLKEWEVEINRISSVYVKVENDFDLEKPPIDFDFISDYISSYVDLTENPVVFCSCVDCDESSDDCCPNNSDSIFAYNKARCLQLPIGYPIYECNRLCKCDNNCINRVVQHGPKVKVAIFRTKNGCGWGLKTLEPVQKGQFVLEYLGEIITSEHAARREEVYIHLGRTYIFDMGYMEDCFYAIDAMLYGNASHFINHSCEPNLVSYSVWINQQNPRLPRIALFAKRKIKTGEELTFDYKMNVTYKDGRVSKNGLVSCKCNSRKCRKYLS